MEICDVVEKNVFEFLDNISRLHFCMVSKEKYNLHFHVLIDIRIGKFLETSMEKKIALFKEFVEISNEVLKDSASDMLGDLFDKFMYTKKCRFYAYEFYEFNQIVSDHIVNVTDGSDYKGILTIVEDRMRES